MAFRSLVGVAVCALGYFLGAAQVAQAQELVGIAKASGRWSIIHVDASSPFVPTSVVPIQNLRRNEELLALDVRPATGELYGITNTRDGLQLYRVDSDTGVVTPVGRATAELSSGPLTKFGMDFNPTIDRIRVVTDRGQNIVLNPIDGTRTDATNLFYASGDANAKHKPDVADIAYDNNDTDPTTATQQRGIDASRNTLVTVANNAGTLTTIGSLGLEVNRVGGFDVGQNGVAYAVIDEKRARGQQLFQINLQTGRATSRGYIALAQYEFRSLAIMPTLPPVATVAKR